MVRRSDQAYNLSTYGNKDVIAVDQDRLGRQGTIVSFDGTHLVLAKPLVNGDVAVTLFNEGDTDATMSTTVSDVGMKQPKKSYRLKDLWTKTVSQTSGTISADVPAHATVMYRLSNGRPENWLWH